MHINKRREQKGATPSNSTLQKEHSTSSQLFADNRPEVVVQRTLQKITNVNGHMSQLRAIPDMEIGRHNHLQAAQLQSMSSVIQREVIDGIEVTLSGKMPQWEQGGRTYHVNLTTDPPHVTCEDYPAPTRKKKNRTTKMHFFYTGGADGIKDAVSGQRGKKKFSDLPSAVQDFVADNYLAIISVRE